MSRELPGWREIQTEEKIECVLQIDLRQGLPETAEELKGQQVPRSGPDSGSKAPITTRSFKPATFVFQGPAAECKPAQKVAPKSVFAPRSVSAFAGNRPIIRLKSNQTKRKPAVLAGIVPFKKRAGR